MQHGDHGDRRGEDPERGEVAEFDTRIPHWFGPTGDQPVEILSVHGSHGERIHVRAAPRQEHHPCASHDPRSPR